MAAKKKKIKTLTEKQYEEYIAALRDDPALYNADGSLILPEEMRDKSEPTEGK